MRTQRFIVQHAATKERHAAVDTMEEAVFYALAAARNTTEDFYIIDRRPGVGLVRAVRGRAGA